VVKAAVEVSGSDITVDLEGSSPQVDWGGNVVYNFTYAYVFMALKSMLEPDIPNNDGCAAPIHLEAPEGSVVNCPLSGGRGRADADSVTSSPRSSTGPWPRRCPTG